MTRFALTLEFDGTPFAGLQRQATAPTVQAAVEDAAFAVIGEPVTLHAAGRTDAGVHALAMRAHIDTAKDIAPFRLMEAINAHLRPAPVAVLACAARCIASASSVGPICQARSFSSVSGARRFTMRYS